MRPGYLIQIGALMTLFFISSFASVAGLDYASNVSHSFAMNDTITGLNLADIYDWVTITNYNVAGLGASSNALTTSDVPDVFVNGTPNIYSILMQGRPYGSTFAYFPYGKYFATPLDENKYNFTIELWYKPASGNNDTEFRMGRSIWGQFDSSTGVNGSGGFYLTRNYSGEDRFYCFSWAHPNFIGSTSLRYIELCNTNYDATNSGNDTWLHLAVSHNGGDGAAGAAWITLLLNGTNVSHYDYPEQFTEANYTTGVTSSFNLGITYNVCSPAGCGTAIPDAYMDEFRIWNVSRSEENISRTINMSFPGVGAGEGVNNVNISFTIYDEDSFVPLTNVSVNASGALYATGFNSLLSQNVSVFTENGSFSLSNVDEGRWEVRFGPLQDEGYLSRTRIFFYNNSNGTRIEKLFLVNTSVAPNFVTVTLLDETNQPIPNFTVQSQRRFVSEGYLPIEDAVTDSNGQTTMSFHLNTIPYRFLIRNNNTNVVTIDPVTVRDDTLTLRISLLSDPLVILRRQGTSEPRISFSNESGNLSVIFDDAEGVSDWNTLRTTRFTAADRSEVCLVNTTGSTAWSNCTVPNESGTTFLSQFCIHWPNGTDTGTELECHTSEDIMGTKPNLGIIGVFVGVVLIMILIIAGLLAGGLAGGMLGLSLGFILLELGNIWMVGYEIGAASLILTGLVIYTMKT